MFSSDSDSVVPWGVAGETHSLGNRNHAGPALFKCSSNGPTLGKDMSMSKITTGMAETHISAQLGIISSK